MRLASISRYDNSGISNLAWEFNRNLNIEKIQLVSNGVFQTFPERYADKDTRTAWDYDWLLSGVDCLIAFETFYDWGVVLEARRRGVKTILVTMFEVSPKNFPYIPDLLLCPSKLDYEIFQKSSTQVEYLPLPVATDRLPWKKRTTAKHFIHTASHGGIGGRKGTGLLLEAMKMVKSDIKLTIYSWKNFVTDDPRIEVKVANFKNYWQLWKEGDVLIYPQGVNGICLPIVEAMASGMGVITTDIYPFNEYFPKELLFKPSKSFKTRLGANLMEVEDFVIEPKAIAEKIDEWANKDISKFSEYGKTWAIDNSWDVLRSRYKDLINDL